MKYRSAVCLLAGVLTVPCLAQQTNSCPILSVKLREVDIGAPSILNLSSGRIVQLNPEAVKKAEAYVKAFKGAGDLLYDNVDGGTILIASGECVRMDREQVLANRQTPSDSLVRRQDTVKNVREDEFLLVKTIEGRYALSFIEAVTQDSAEIRWILTQKEKKMFDPDELLVFLASVTRQTKRTVSGVCTISSLNSDRPTVFLFSDGKEKRFPMLRKEIKTEEDWKKYNNLHLVDPADIAYEGGSNGANFALIYPRRCGLLGRGTLEDFAGRDVASVARRAKGELRGKDLVAGTIVAMQDRGGKFGMFRVENAGTNELKFQWVYLADGSSVFPKVAPLPDAAQTVPDVRDIKTEAQSRLMRLVYQSAQMTDEEVKAEFRKIIDDGADVNRPLDSGNTPLTEAAAVGSKSLVESMIGAMGNMNQSAALHAAAQSGRVAICELLLAKGADRSFRNKDGLTAFDVAKNSSRSNADVLRLCQPEEAEAKTVHNAALLGETNLLRNLIAKGGDVNAYDRSTGKTPLVLAAEAGHVEACRMLVDAGADVEKGIQIRKTFPTVLAVQAGQTNVVLYLCTRASDKQVAEAFYEAFLRKRPELGKAIIEQSKDASVLYRSARDMIDSLLRVGNKGVYSLLLSKDVALPLWAAAANGDTNAVKKAIDAGEGIERSGSDYWGTKGETPLMAAVMNGQYDTAKMLLSAGADPNRVLPRSGTTYTPLFNAVETGDECLVDLLLKNKADVNATNHMGWTPLYVAVRRDHPSIVKALLESGADTKNIPALRAKDGKVASLRDQTRNKETIELLRRHGE